MFEGMLQALLLATLNKALVDFLAEPVLRKRPELDLWWLCYVALVTGFVMAWFAGVDFLTGQWVKDPMTGRILSCLAVGAGTNLINTVFVDTGPTAPVRALDDDISGKYRGW